MLIHLPCSITGIYLFWSLGGEETLSQKARRGWRERAVGTIFNVNPGTGGIPGKSKGLHVCNTVALLAFPNRLYFYSRYSAFDPISLPP